MSTQNDTHSKLLTELRELTDANQHTEALLQIAKHFRLRKLVKAFEAIETLHIELGSLDFGLYEARQRLSAYMFSFIKDHHGEKVRRQIYDCL